MIQNQDLRSFGWSFNNNSDAGEAVNVDKVPTAGTAPAITAIIYLRFIALDHMDKVTILRSSPIFLGGA